MKTIVELLERSYRRYASKPALRHKVGGEWREMTYRDLWQESDRMAAGLARFGLAAEDRAALFAGASPAWMTAYFGILKAGGIAVPIDKELKSAELRHILADSGARLLFTETTYLDLLTEILDELPALTKIVCLDAGPGDAAAAASVVTDLQETWRRIADRYGVEQAEIDNFGLKLNRIQDLVGTGVGAPGGDGAANLVLPGEEGHRHRLLQQRGLAFAGEFVAEDPLPEPSADPQATAVILYTSGTTGRSKGAMLSHANIVSNIEAGIATFGVDDSITTLSFLPINHVYEQVCGILLPLTAGGTISFAESIRKLGANLAEVRPTFLLGVPAVFRLVLDRIRRNLEENRLASLLFSFAPTRPVIAAKVRRSLGDNTIYISGGAALDPEVAKGLGDFGITVFQGYGITETSPIIAMETPTCRSLGTVGHPLPGVEVRIDHPNEDGIGEIQVKGPNVMQGYFNNPRATVEVLRDGWYATGDLGCLDADGFLAIRGRAKNLIVTPNGKNVYPEEIENELMHSPFIAEAMVYGHRLSPTAEEVHAMIFPDQEMLDNHAEKNGTAPLGEKDVEDVIRREVLQVSRRLADYKRIKKFTLKEEEFPKTTTRKIKRFEVEAAISTSD